MLTLGVSWWKRHERRDWIEPLLDELGPYIQLQLGDLTNLLEVLANFYRWTAPWKTADTLFFFGCCLLITLLTDMVFCMKVVWFVAGGWFLCFPIATRFPKYRYLVDPFKWTLWDIPTDAEWSTEFLQRKASEQQKEMTEGKEHADITEDPSDDESPSPDYETPTTLLKRGVSPMYQNFHNGAIFRFRAFQANSRGHILIGRSGVRFESRARHWSIPYGQLIEMCKVKPDPRIKVLTLGIGSSGLRFMAVDGQGAHIEETITVHEDKQGEIFNVVLGWNGLKWRAVCIERQRGKNINGRKEAFSDHNS